MKVESRTKQASWRLTGTALLNLLFLLCPFIPAKNAPVPETLLLPHTIEKNKGQFPSQYDFGFRGQGYLFLFNSQKIDLVSSPDYEPVTLEFVGVESDTEAPVVRYSAGRSNYLIGASDRWVIDVPLVESVLYPEIYPGIDLQFRISGNLLEYDLIVAPGADPDQVRLEIAGADAFELDSSGDLIVEEGEGKFVQRRPHVFQKTQSGFVEIECVYKTSVKRVTLELAEFDPGLELVVDPILEYRAVLPGSGSESEPRVTFGPDGRIYVAGTTKSTDLPTSNGYQNEFQGGFLGDGFVLCLSPDGSEVVFLTYFGGSESDAIRAIAVDREGIYVTGRTNSPNFPITNAFQSERPGSDDAFLAKLSLQGNTLDFSTYLGGTDAEYAWDLDVGAGGVFVVGSTASDDFPVLNAFQPTLAPTTDYGGRDYFVSKFGSSGQMLFSTYLGGSEYELGSISVKAVGQRVYAAATSQSSDYPLKDPLRNAPTGQDVVLTALNASSGELLFSTFWGGDALDEVADLAIAGDGSLYLVGNTGSSDFPIVSPLPDQRADPQGAFLTKLRPDQSVEYSRLFWEVGFSEGAAIGTPSGGLLLGYAGSSRGMELVDPLPIEVNFGPYVALLDSEGKVTFSSFVAEHGTVESVALGPDEKIAFVGITSRSESISDVNSPFPRVEGQGMDVFIGLISMESPLTLSLHSGAPQSARVERPFSDRLQAKVSEAGGEGVPEIAVTFVAPESGASALFEGGETTVEVMTDSSGIATSPELTANSTAGDYEIVATAEDVGDEARFPLTNLPRIPSSIAVISGDGQVVEIGAPLPQPFTVRILDEDGEGFPDQAVTFAAPSSGASGTFPSGSSTLTVPTDSSGKATSEILTANLEVGTYAVIASVPDLDTTATFSVTNTIGSPSQVRAYSGGNQVASVDEPFLQPFQARVTDLGGNPFESISVTFQAPESGPSGTFAEGSRSTTALTDAQGIATSSTFTANSVGGSYSVIATADGVDSQAAFPLRNSTNAILTVGSSTAAKGATVEIPVELYRGNEIVAMLFQVTYDPNVLTLRSMAPGALLTGHLLELNSAIPGQIRAAFASTDLDGVATGSSGILNLSFELSASVAVDSTWIRLMSVNALSSDTALVEVELRSGLLSILKEVCPGDLNIDSSRDVRDLALVLGHILGQNELSETALLAADLNDDGIVDVKDFVLMLNGITGAQPIAPCP